MGDLFKFTSAVNPGKILESLAASYVDIVLHGHEHRRNIARYGSYRIDSNQIVIAAAASATGAETFKGCDSQRASFNVLELRSDRSVWMNEVRGPQGDQSEWHSTPSIQILDSTTLRHNRFLRSLHLWRKARTGGPKGNAGAGQQSEWHTLPSQQDGMLSLGSIVPIGLSVRESLAFEFRTTLDRLLYPLQRLTLLAPPQSREFAGFLGWERRGAYVFRVATGTSEPVAASSIATSYQWLDGIVLTEDDLKLIDMNNAGPFRGNGQEFVAASVTRPLRELSLSVTFPVGFVPDEKQVDVYYQRMRFGEAVKEPALRKRIKFMAQAVILTVPYPLMDYRYVIAWRPVKGVAPTPQANDFRDRCSMTDLGDRLATSFIKGVKSAKWGDNCSLALYVQEPNCTVPGKFLRRVGFATGILVEGGPSGSTANTNRYGQAAWLVSSFMVGRDGDRCMQSRRI